MKEFLKKQRIAFYASLISALFGLVGVILYIACANGGYYNDLKIYIIALFAAAILGAVALIYIGEKYGNNSKWRLLHIVVVALFTITLMAILNARVFSFAILLGSDLEASNAEAYTRLYYSIASMISILLADISSIIGSFSKYIAE